MRLDTLAAVHVNPWSGSRQAAVPRMALVKALISALPITSAAVAVGHGRTLANGGSRGAHQEDPRP
jgi:hypothetical protein